MVRKEMTPAQQARQQEEHRDHGRYAKVNPCYVCGKSAGVNYFSHPDTDNGIADALLVLCPRCAKATQDMPGPEAVEWARKHYPDTFVYVPWKE